MDHARPAIGIVARHTLGFVQRNGHALRIGMVDADMIGDRGAVIVELDPADHAVAARQFVIVRDVARIAEPVRIDQSKAGLVGAAPIVHLDVAERFAIDPPMPIGGIDHRPERLGALGIAELAAVPVPDPELSLDGLRPIHRPFPVSAHGLEIGAGVKPQPRAYHRLGTAIDAAGDDRVVAHQIARAAYDFVAAAQMFGIGMSDPPAPVAHLRAVTPTGIIGAVRAAHAPEVHERLGTGFHRRAEAREHAHPPKTTPIERRRGASVPAADSSSSPMRLVSVPI